VGAAREVVERGTRRLAPVAVLDGPRRRGHALARFPNRDIETVPNQMRDAGLQ
jgi:hypothetical protein